MWDGLFTLLLLGVVMAVASFLAGLLPLTISLNPRKMRLITACGTGVLVGTALIVIIPEGIETLYSAAPSTASHPARDVINTRDVPWMMPAKVSDSGSMWTERDNLDISLEYSHGTRAAEEDSKFTGPDDGNPIAGESGSTDEDAGQTKPVESEEPANNDHDHDFEPHAWVGVSLISGFILMYLIDRIPQIASGPVQPRTSYISLESLGLHRTSSRPDEPDVDSGVHHVGAHSSSRPSSLTTGLVIHAAADGIALGASSTSSSGKLGFIVFVALMIHKAPAAFGLTSVLLKQGLSTRRARTHLIIFSLAAPVGALATWTAAHVLGGGSLGGDENTEFATGILLLFSGGTFLYVAMHTMQDGGHDHTAANGHTGNGYADPYAPVMIKQEGPTMIETLATVGGMLIPLLTQFGHSH